MPNYHLCKTDSPKLAKSHILPRSFYGPTLKSPSGPATIISLQAGFRPIRSPIGEYDQNLLCPACETKLADLDDYAYRSFYAPNSVHFVEVAGERLAEVCLDVNVAKIRAFFCSLVWRMHETRRQMFHRVRLGKYAEAFRTATISGDPSHVPEMDVITTKFDTAHNAIPGPLKRKLCGLNGYQISFSGFSSWVKVDSRPTRDPFDEIALSGSETELRVLLADYRQSPERRMAARLVKEFYSQK